MDVARIGLVTAPSPLEPAPGLAAQLGAEALWLKRDDLIPALHGGSKVRKLDLMLAAEPWASAPGWVVSGAVGSGQVAATVAAGRALDRPVHAHLFRTPIGEHGRENLAYSVSYASSVRGYHNRADLALRGLPVLVARRTRQGAVIPPGATERHAMLGTVLGGMELADQLDGADAVYVAYGTGGTVVGVATGLALRGQQLPVRAVGVVEPILSPRARIDQLVRQLAAELAGLGLRAPPARIELLRGQLGAGYAKPTEASLRGAALLAEAGVAGEPVYTGKALAAMAADLAAGRCRRPVFWVTVRRGGLPFAPDWEARLPAALRDLAPGDRAFSPSRRAILAGAAAAVGLVGLVRCGGYPGPAGEVIGAAERAVLRAAGEALFPDADAATLDALPDRVDRYLLTFPEAMRLEVHALFFAVEHSVALAAGLHRFSAATPADRLAALERVAALGGPGMLVARSLRDLVLIAWYQAPEAWEEIGYEGPMVGPEARESAYDVLRAPPGWRP